MDEPLAWNDHLQQQELDRTQEEAGGIYAARGVAFPSSCSCRVCVCLLSASDAMGWLCFVGFSWTHRMYLTHLISVVTNSYEAYGSTGRALLMAELYSYNSQSLVSQ